VLHPGQLGLGARGQAVGEAAVAGELGVAVAAVGRRIADDPVGESVRGPRAHGVDGVDVAVDAGQQQAGTGDAGEIGVGAAAPRALRGRREQQRPDAAGRIEQGAGVGQRDARHRDRRLLRWLRPGAQHSPQPGAQLLERGGGADRVGQLVQDAAQLGLDPGTGPIDPRRP
jgi:hypothetical protein